MTLALINPLRYAKPEDVHTRLNGCILKYKGIPVYAKYHQIQKVGEDANCVDLYDNHNGKEYYAVHSSDEDLDVSACDLGYVNHKNVAVYATRMPTRKHRQGLCVENCVAFSGDTLECHPIGAETLRSRQFFAMLNNQYPSLEVAVKAMSEKGKGLTSFAFNRRLALAEDPIGLLKLHYLARPIAVYSKRRELFSLSERFAHYEHILSSFQIPLEVG